jgi:hypothetical protein
VPGQCLMDNSHDPVIHVFYRPQQLLAVDSAENFSKSPQKPRLLLEFLSRHGLNRHFVRHGDWPPFERQDFLLAQGVLRDAFCLWPRERSRNCWATMDSVLFRLAMANETPPACLVPDRAFSRRKSSRITFGWRRAGSFLL